MISLRLSSAEYEQFREFCAAHSASSVSELTRVAISRLIRDPSFAPENLLESRVNDLESQLHVLSLELKRAKESTPSK